MNRDNLLWGSLLILAGVLFLGNSLNFFRINVWGLLWPIALMALGAYILWGYFKDPKDALVETLAVPLEETQEAAITIAYGAGQLNLGAGAAQGHLLDAQMGGGGESDVQRQAGRTAVSLRRKWQVQNVTTWQRGANEWDVRLAPGIPLALKLEGGASQTAADLRGLLVRDLRVETGASQTDIVLPQAAGATTVRIEAGAAQVNITVPEGVAARIKASGGLADFNVDTARFPRMGDGYESPDYASAIHRVDLKIEAGLGSVRIQ